MSNGQTGPHYPTMDSPMYALSPLVPPGISAPHRAPDRTTAAKAGCAGCASTYGNSYASNDYGRTPNLYDRGFQGPVFGNGVFSSGRRAARFGHVASLGSSGCGNNYVHPSSHQSPGHVGCGQRQCQSNSAAVMDIYSRDNGKYVGCGANAVGDRLSERKMYNAVKNWQHRLPKERYMDVVKEFGEPDWIVNQPGGEAVWLNRAFYTRIVLRDESVEHSSPQSHCDFLYGTIGGIDLPREGIDEIFQISQSLSYDQLKKELTARCHAMGPVVATLLIALDTALDDELTLEQAKQAYPKMVADTSDPSIYVEMAQALEENVMEAQAGLQNKPNFQCQ